MLSDAELLALLPEEMLAEGRVRVERQAVLARLGGRLEGPFSSDGHRPACACARLGSLRRAGGALVDVVINPGLAFGTGLHATTRGTLTLLQEGAPRRRRTRPAGSRGALVDVGTGSGILSIAAAKLGWGPIIAFDNDAVALSAARENIVANGVGDVVQVHECAAGRGSARLVRRGDGAGQHDARARC